MKKKLALLLVLTMVLGLIPANVFASIRPTTPSILPGVHPITIDLPFHQISQLITPVVSGVSTSSAIRLAVELTGGANFVGVQDPTADNARNIGLFLGGYQSGTTGIAGGTGHVATITTPDGFVATGNLDVRFYRRDTLDDLNQFGWIVLQGSALDSLAARPNQAATISFVLPVNRTGETGHMNIRQPIHSFVTPPASGANAHDILMAGSSIGTGVTTQTMNNRNLPRYHWSGNMITSGNVWHGDQANIGAPPVGNVTAGVSGANVGRNFANELRIETIEIRGSETARIANDFSTRSLTSPWVNPAIHSSLMLRGRQAGYNNTSGAPYVWWSINHASGGWNWLGSGTQAANAPHSGPSDRAWPTRSTNTDGTVGTIQTAVVANGAPWADRSFYGAPLSSLGGGANNPWHWGDTVQLNYIDHLLPATMANRNQAALSAAWFTVRLVAPQFYTWNDTGWNVNSPNNTFNNGTGDNEINHGQNRNVTFNWETHTDGTQRHVAYVRVNANPIIGAGATGATRANSFFGSNEQLNINGLRLMAQPQAPILQNNLTVEAQVGSSARVGSTPWDTFAARRGATHFDQLVVGNRVATEMTVATGEAPEIRTGFLGARQTAGNPNNANLPHYRGDRTARVTLTENVAGIWSGNWANHVDFDFGPGVTVLGARVWIRQGTTNHLGAGGWAAWASATDNIYPVGHRNVTIAPNQVRIHPVIDQTAGNIQNPVTLEIEFYLSVESDFANKHNNGSADIDVTISGPGALHLVGLGSTTQTVGQAVDMISVSMADGITEVQTGPLFNVVNESVSDLVITVEQPTRLEANTEVWVYFTGGLNINNNVTVTAPANSGVQLSAVRTLQHPNGYGGIAFTIHRGINVNTDAFDIVVSNINVSGFVQPGVDYQIVVSGNGIAQNDEAVRIAAQQGGLAANVGRLNVGTFTGHPFAVSAVAHAGGGVSDEPPAPPAPPIEIPVIIPEIVQPREFRFNEFTTNIEGVADPFFWEIIDGNRVGFMSIRAFIYMIGDGPIAADAWNQATNTATVTGTHFNGHPVTVTVNPGNPRAQISGVPGTVDIADFAGASGPSGTISPINRGGTVFLPLRFIAEAFGYTVELVGNTVVFR